MSFVTDRRRATIVALVTVLLGAAALVVGAGSAQAHHQPGDCTNATTGDVTLGVSGVFFVGLNQEQIGNVNGYGFWLCAVPPDQGGGVGFRDPNPSNPTGWGFESSTCGTVTCTMIASMTGAETDPATSTNLPGDGNDTSGGALGLGSGTCVYVDGTPTCPFGITVLGVTVNEADLVPTTDTTSSGCVGINNTCIVPLVNGGRVVVGSDPDPTVSTVVAGNPVNHDVGQQCVQAGMTCP